MTFVALTSLMETIRLQFLQSTPSPSPRVSLHHHAEALIESFIDTLSSLQDFLQKESSGADGVALRDLEIQIRNFALKAEDDIEIQLSSILLAEDGEYREQASYELYQSLPEAAKNATELLKILATQKEPCLSVREMASVALTILISNLQYYFLQPFPKVSLDDGAAMLSFFQNLSSLRTCLLKMESEGGAAIKNLETKIRNFALKAEEGIQVQLSNFFLAKDQEDASQELCQTMQEATEKAAELLKIINKEIEHQRERRMACNDLISRSFTIQGLQLKDKAPIQSFCNNLRSLHTFLQEESSGDGTALRDLEIQISSFVYKARDDIEMQLIRHGENPEIVSHELHQTLQEATKNATELLKIIARRKESCVSEGDMAIAALSILMTKYECYFLQPSPKVSLDEAAMLSFLENLSALQAFLFEWKSNGGAAIKKFGTKIKNFALKAEEDIEIKVSNFHMHLRMKSRTQNRIRQILGQLLGGSLLRTIGDCMGVSNFILAKDTEHEDASQELRQTLQEAAEIAAELLKIINKEVEPEREREMTCSALTFLRETIEKSLIHQEGIKSNFLQELSSLQVFLWKESSGGGDTTKDLKDTIKDFALQLSNFFQAKETKSQHKASRELRYQALQEATENITELLKIVAIEKEYPRQMASDALNVFKQKFDDDFLNPTPIVLLDDKAAMISFSEKLSSLQAYLWQKESGGGAAINDFGTEIRDFVLKAEDDIETQIKYAIQAINNTEYQEKASQLSRTLQEAAERAEELLMIINSEKECDEKTDKAYVALSCFMGTIEKEFLEDEAEMKSFLEDISSLQAFLQKESSGGAAVKDLKTKIKDFALKATKLQEYEEKFPQEVYQTTREAAKGAAELLKIINNRNNEVDEANESEPSNSWLKHASKSENRMVGRHHDYTVIKDRLFSSFYEPKIISIVGMVGIGKTTLAKNLYEDPSVASRFNARCWITIHQDYNKSRMLSDLLQSIMPAEPNAIKKGSTVDELKDKVRIRFLGKRYLIVLDNILSIHQDWIVDIIVSCFPRESHGIKGSCILLTATHLNRKHFRQYIHYMSLLNPKESWDLFCNILPIKEHLAPNFETIRNDVVEKCDGLPQLIVEVAKRLSKCNNIQEGWKKIAKELESLGILDRNALTVNYNLLPHYLKICFLYIGIFPKRNKIMVKMLIRLWIAEGFVAKPWGYKELEDEAYTYLQELSNRSLLLIENRSSDCKIKTCRMHSAIHSFCVGEAQKEGILCAVNTQQHSGLSLDAFANSCRWLSLCSHSFDYYVLFGTNIPRSIFFFHEKPEMFVPLKLLRVLAFDTSISLQRLPVQLRDLVFLRYLSITKWFEDMDYVLSNNLNLETLVVSSNGAPTVQLPSSIWNPLHLRHLELGNSYIVDPPSMVKMNFRSLSCVMRSINCRKEVFNKFPNIKNLKIFLKDDIEPSPIVGSCSNPIILDHFDYLERLERLNISISVGCNAALPKQCMYPSGLKKLKLSGTNISERDLNVIAKLPRLMVLKLENAFHGTVWNVFLGFFQGGFPELIFLLLEAKELKQWIFKDRSAFWKLRHLVLRSCNCLEEIPKGFANIDSLETIELEGCNSSLVTSAKQLQQKRRFRNLEIKIIGPKYDESQNTHTEVSM